MNELNLLICYPMQSLTKGVQVKNYVGIAILINNIFKQNVFEVQC